MPHSIARSPWWGTGSPEFASRDGSFPAGPESVLAEQARGADLLVLGSAAPLAGDGRLGAVVLSCLRRPPCPVVVVPPMGLDASQPVAVELAEAR
ncbi:hypothetical protein GCM10020220_085410 [Nonomuraea rubra]|uniref:universal stress protein n=1 Tax=Nonomuraea rubra TaxID=46180 RepID=UPI003389931F